MTLLKAIFPSEYRTQQLDNQIKSHGHYKIDAQAYSQIPLITLVEFSALREARVSSMITNC